MSRPRTRDRKSEKGRQLTPQEWGRSGDAQAATPTATESRLAPPQGAWDHKLRELHKVTFAMSCIHQQLDT